MERWVIRIYKSNSSNRFTAESVSGAGDEDSIARGEAALHLKGPVLAKGYGHVVYREVRDPGRFPAHHHNGARHGTAVYGGIDGEGWPQEVGRGNKGGIAQNDEEYYPCTYEERDVGGEGVIRTHLSRG